MNARTAAWAARPAAACDTPMARAAGRSSGAPLAPVVQVVRPAQVPAGKRLAARSANYAEEKCAARTNGAAVLLRAGAASLVPAVALAQLNVPEPEVRARAGQAAALAQPTALHYSLMCGRPLPRLRAATRLPQNPRSSALARSKAYAVPCSSKHRRTRTAPRTPLTWTRCIAINKAVLMSVPKSPALTRSLEIASRHKGARWELAAVERGCEGFSTASGFSHCIESKNRRSQCQLSKTEQIDQPRSN
jgi:hypothetical protein